MKARKFILLCFLFLLLAVSCYSDNVNIISVHCSYEKMVFYNYHLEMEITLASIANNERTHEIIENLIYQGMDFDEYVEYREREFIGDARGDFYPLYINDDGSVYIYRSLLDVDYSIQYYCEEYVIVRCFEYYYHTGMPHGIYWFNYLIIDIRNERLLLIEDLINDIPDYVLLEIIEDKYDIRYYLRENIWPPDAVNFSGVGVELLWNIYQITPYNVGLIRIIINEFLMEEYLTNIGKELWSLTGALR